MQIHQLQSRNKKRKRIARGGKRGTYSGRGVKGQKSRSGYNAQPVVRELIKKYPKLRGYRFKADKQNVFINVGVLEEKFKDGDKITPAVLINKGITDKIKGRTPLIKILGKGELTKKFTIEACQASKSAKEKIEKAGGIIK